MDEEKPKPTEAAAPEAVIKEDPEEIKSAAKKVAAKDAAAKEVVAKEAKEEAEEIKAAAKETEQAHDLIKAATPDKINKKQSLM